MLSTKLIQDASSKETELVQQQTLCNAITTLFNDPHTPVIINAAITMGEKEGITGHDYPRCICNSPVSMDTSLTMSIDKEMIPRRVQKNKGCYYTCLPCKKCKCVGVCVAMKDFAMKYADPCIGG